MHRIETIAIGDELLTGRISDTNSTFVAAELFQIGLRLQHVSVIPDDAKAIREQLLASARRADTIVCFGGLGPTSDDKTAETVATLLGGQLLEHAESKARLVQAYTARNRPLTAQALKQILYPERSTPLLNTAGMAPAFRCEIEGSVFYFLPGVPREMKAIFSEHILPLLKAQGADIRSYVWKCLGIWESDLQRQMDPIEAGLPPGAWLGYRTRFPENHLTLYAHADLGDTFFALTTQAIRSVLKPWAYTESPDELERLIQTRLIETGQSVAFAESCTGGLAVQRLTRLPGASNCVWGGVAVYQAKAKSALLGVTIKQAADAVSESCTLQLLENLKQRSGCAVVAAITGYLGPTGGTADDPVGTLYIAVDASGNRLQRKIQLTVKNREEGQWGASTYQLHSVYEAIR